MNKLYSIEQIEEWASKRADDAGRLSRQLLDTMRENERLRKELYVAKDAFDDIGAEELSQRTYDVLHPNKDRENKNG